MGLPVVLVLWATPVVYLAVTDAIGDSAKIVGAGSADVDVDLFLRVLEPAVVVVETEAQVERVLTSRHLADVPVVRMSPEERTLRVFRLDDREPAVGPASADDLRALLVCCLYASRHRNHAPSAPPAPRRR